MAGALIGSTCALLSYGVYYRSPFWVGEGMELSELGRPREVYGFKEGGIRLEDEEEFVEGEEQA